MSGEKQQQPGSRITRIVVLMVAFIMGGAVVLFSIRAFVLQPFVTPATNMSPNIVEGDYFFASKLTYLLRAPLRGEIVVFSASGNDHVSRIVGLPGDRIQMRDGVLLINGEAMPRHEEEVNQLLMPSTGGTFYRESLPNGASYVVFEEADDGPGDNTDEITVPDGQYFMMGDNRDNSADSRFTDSLSTVPAGNLTGPAVFRVFNREGFPFAIRPLETAGKD